MSAKNARLRSHPAIVVTLFGMFYVVMSLQGQMTSYYWLTNQSDSKKLTVRLGLTSTKLGQTMAYANEYSGKNMKRNASHQVNQFSRLKRSLGLPYPKPFRYDRLS
ncbi:unnamed protein product [Cercopithifilaria johnstoni]|uniref:Uncharacterized protein n=1 Tax=Cercopithifilaria johnstoni TaxID=2874296 RepID=A0A8J2PPR6_9BILA|nr:unnamed protein product [Cercopithifilaria johnstoni]